MKTITHNQLMIITRHNLERGMLYTKRTVHIEQSGMVYVLTSKDVTAGLEQAVCEACEGGIITFVNEGVCVKTGGIVMFEAIREFLRG